MIYIHLILTRSLLLVMLMVLFGTKSYGAPQKKWVESWTPTAPLNKPRVGTASGVYGKAIYVAGGAFTNTDDGLLDTVEVSTVKPDGSLAPWLYARKLSSKRVFAVGIVHKDYFYVIGGEKGLKDEDLLKTIERAQIMPDYSLGKWIVEKNEMATPRRSPVVFILNNRLYVSGGFNGVFLKDVESAEINEDGSLGAFRNESSDTKFERYIHSGITYQDTMLVFGGHSTKPGGALDSMELTTVNSEDGYLNMWQEGPVMPTKRYLNGIALHYTTIYLVGGRNTVLLTEVSKISFVKGKKVNPSEIKWGLDTPLTTPREGLSLALLGDNMYAIGGRSFDGILSSVERATIIPGKKLGHWTIDKAKKTTKTSPVNEDAVSHFTLASEYIKFDHFDSGILEIREGIRLAPNVPEGYMLLGETYMKNKDHKSAKEAFLKALSIRKNYPDAQFKLGLTYYNLQEYNNAIATYKLILAQHPENRAARRNLATTYIDNKEYKKAISELEILLKNEPDDEMLKGFLKYAKFMLGENK